MTWADFKAAVEAKGVKDSDEIGFIDVSSPGISDIEVNFDEHEAGGRTVDIC